MIFDRIFMILKLKQALINGSCQWFNDFKDLLPHAAAVVFRNIINLNYIAVQVTRVCKSRVTHRSSSLLKTTKDFPLNGR